MQSASKKDAPKKSNLNFRMHNTDFVLVDSLWTRSLPSSKFLRNPGDYAKKLYTCFVDLEKAKDRVPRDMLWEVLLDYDVRGQLLAAIKSLCKWSEICVPINTMKTKPFNVSVGL